MSSWFYLDFQADWAGDGPVFGIELDTKPPTLAFAKSSYSVNQGDTLDVAWTLDEPQVVGVWFRVGTASRPIVYDQTGATYAIPEAEPNEEAFVDVLVRDDVGNEHTYSVAVVVGTVAPPPVKPPVFPGPPGPHKPAVHRHIDRFSAKYLVTAKTVDKFTARYIVKRKERIQASFTIVQHNEDRTEVMLSVSTRMAQIRREDDEILAIL